MSDTGRRRLLLVVDDEDDMRFLLELYLRPAGFDVDTARDGLEAMKRLSDEPDVDLILLDLRMPKLDGWGVLDAIREHPGLSEIPVVVLSAHASAETAAEALAAGAAAFMNKPFTQEQLLAAVQGSIDG